MQAVAIYIQAKIGTATTVLLNILIVELFSYYFFF